MVDKYVYTTVTLGVIIYAEIEDNRIALVDIINNLSKKVGYI
jgi:hypothetical protein